MTDRTQETFKNKGLNSAAVITLQHNKKEWMKGLNCFTIGIALYKKEGQFD